MPLDCTVRALHLYINRLVMLFLVKITLSTSLLNEMCYLKGRYILSQNPSIGNITSQFLVEDYVDNGQTFKRRRTCRYTFCTEWRLWDRWCKLELTKLKYNYWVNQQSLNIDCQRPKYYKAPDLPPSQEYCSLWG